MPFFISQGIITSETLLIGLKYFPLVPLGVWLGIWLYQKVSERLFLRLVYLVTFFAGLQLILNLDLAKLFH